MRIFFLSLLITLFAGAAANAQTVDMPGNDKSKKDTEQTDRSGGLGRSRGRGERDKEESEDDEGAAIV